MAANLIYMAKQAWTDLLDSIRTKSGISGTLTASEAKDAVDGIQDGIANILNDTLTSYSNSDATSLKAHLFEGLTNLRSVIMPALTIMNEYAFSGAGLTSADFPELTRVKSYGFNGCTSLTSVDIPKCYGTESYAFAGCTNLRSITLGKVESTGLFFNAEHAFDGCENLETLVAPGKWQYISGSEFKNCAKLTSMPQAIDQGLGNIGSSAFSGCVSLTAEEIATIGQIYNYAFDGCTSLGPKLKIKANKIGSSTSSGGAASFRGCTGLKAIWIPKSYSGNTTIYAGTNAETRVPFWGCTQLADIYTNADSKPSTWGTYFANTGSSTQATVHYGVSEADFDALTV